MNKHTTLFIQAGSLLLPVWAETAAARSYERPGAMKTAMDGTRWTVRAPRAAQDLALTFELTRPDELATLMALVHGEFGRGPFRLVDAWAARVNALSAHASLLGHWLGSPSVSVSEAPIPLDGGGFAGRSVIGAEAGVLLTAGWPHAAVAPPAGEWVTVSAYATAAAQVRLRPVWHTRESETWVNGPLVTIPAPGGVVGPPRRYSATAQVPESVTPAGGSAGPVARVGFQVYDASRITRPAITWTRELTEWGVGESARGVLLEPPAVDPVKAYAGRNGRAATVTLTAREVGPA